MKTKHTPTPWKYSPAPKSNPGLITVSTDYPEALCNGARSVASITGSEYCDHKSHFYKPEVHAENIANAQFIALACNHHEELVEALENVISCMDANDGDSLANAANTARSLLTKLKG